MASTPLLLPRPSYSSRLIHSPSLTSGGRTPSRAAVRRLGRSIMRRMWLAMGVVILFGSSGLVRADWQPAKGPLLTRWAKDVSPERVHPEYPRPQLVRPDWLNLNGLWQLAFAKEADRVP